MQVQPLSIKEGRALTGLQIREEGRKHFVAIYREHHAFVWRTLRRLGVAEANLEDALQEVFLSIHRRLPEFEGRSSLKTWIYRIMVHFALKHRARQASRARWVEVDDSLPDSRPGPDRDLVNKQAMARVLSALGELDEDKRAIFVAIEMEGMTMAEAAVAMNISLNTGYSRLRLARQAFARGLAHTPPGKSTSAAPASSGPGRGPN